jgi:hypothetical protein
MFESWFRNPRVRLWAAIVVATSWMVARKSWALLTPQLWAEDGTIHLNDNDQWGLHAFLLPYRGYLHTIPRLIAWLASRVADPAYWPAIYNGACLIITVLLLVRLASRRIELPAKPGLILAFGLLPNSGEVLFNITNVHWITGLFLVLQSIIARPTTFTQRCGDFLVIVLVGLTDPSAIIFLPLFVWRWWRARHGDNLAVLLLVVACASVQGYLIAKTGPHFEAQSQPLHVLSLLQTAGSRLIIWPFFGAKAVSLIAPVVQAVIATGVIVALFGWAARPDLRRPARLHLMAAWFLLSFACIYRSRPDTWGMPLENLSYAEPYFFLARLLLFWLVIWEFDARPRAVAYTARAACVLAIPLSLPDFRIPAPPDYHWAEHCDPVRQGVAANIPTLPEGWTLEYHGRPKR